MPCITVQSLELTKEQKKELAQTYISKFSEVTNVPKDRVYLFFDGYPLEDVATNEILFSEHPSIKARGKFNETEWNKEGN